MKDFVTTVKKHDDGGGDVKNYQKLHDVIYERPLYNLLSNYCCLAKFFNRPVRISLFQMLFFSKTCAKLKELKNLEKVSKLSLLPSFSNSL